MAFNAFATLIPVSFVPYTNTFTALLSVPISASYISLTKTREKTMSKTFRTYVAKNTSLKRVKPIWISSKSTADKKASPYPKLKAYTILNKSEKDENLKIPLNVRKMIKNTVLNNTSKKVIIIPSALIVSVRSWKPKRNTNINIHEKIMMRISIKKTLNLDNTFLYK